MEYLALWVLVITLTKRAFSSAECKGSPQSGTEYFPALIWQINIQNT